MILPEVGLSGQTRLQQARVFICGMGALGNPALMYLVAAGVGQITLCDGDRVEKSNLHRQILFNETSVGQFKVSEAVQNVSSQDTDFKIIDVSLTPKNALELLAGHDLVLDCTDSFAARYAINDACVALGIPMVSAAIHRFSGQISVFNSEDGPCYRCFYPTPPPPDLIPDCSMAGVMGFVPGLFGLWQVQEACKIILGAGNILRGKMMLYDALTANVTYLKRKQRLSCICSGQPRVSFEFDNDVEEVEASAVLHKNQTEFLWLDVRESSELKGMPHNYPGIHIPLEELLDRLSEIDPKQSWLVVCKIGERSRTACEILKSRGFLRVKNLNGGLWALVREQRRNITP
jgi:adenylyltransferase/sulfurtransferase